MAKKRKAPSSQHTTEQKPKSLPEEVQEEEEEEETSEEESEEEEEEESESESDDEKEEEESESSSSSDDASKRETLLRELLEPFGKSQIIDLLKEAAAKDPTLLPKIVQVADTDPAHRNVFVHGLGWDATSEQLIDAFEPFGDIEECKLITDKNTGRAKGYAFMRFKTRNAAKKALRVPQKRIGSRNVNCQLAAMGPPPAAAVGAAAEGGGLNMYVGNVGPHVTPEKLAGFFRRFGEIEDGPLGVDPVTNKFKGFAVVTYKSLEGFKKAMEEPIKVFENCQLHCKKFVENQNKNNNLAGQSSVGGLSPTVANVGYGSLGMNMGVFGANSLSASGLMMAQNTGVGLEGNAMLAAGYSPAGLAASGLNTPIAGMGGIYGISPVIGNYGSQAALHGLGAFQNAQTGQSSILTAGTTTMATRAPATSVSAPKTFSYFGR